MTGVSKVLPFNFAGLFNPDAATRRSPRGSFHANPARQPTKVASQPTKVKTMPTIRKSGDGPDNDLEMGSMAVAVRHMYEKFHVPLTESLQNIHTPFKLCFEILSKLEIDSSKTFLVVSAVEFVAILIDVFKVPIDNIFFLDEGVKSATMPTSVKGALMEHVFHMPKQNLLNEESVHMKKFDFIVGNPPYQDKKEGNKKADSRLWQKIILNVTKNIAPGTVVAMIHPSGWRASGGNYIPIRELYDSWDMVYLNTNSLKAGKKVFNAGTRFDWFVAIVQPYQGQTLINDDNGVEKVIDLREYPIIPNDIDVDINKWIGGDEKCEFGYSASWYHCQRDHMSPDKNDEFIFPCIKNVGSTNKPSKLWYSNINKGMFGIPKVIVGAFGSGVFIDALGEYGCTEHCAYIAAPPDELEQVKAALQSEEFQRVAKATYFGGSGQVFDTKFMKLLKKDFWKN